MVGEEPGGHAQLQADRHTEREDNGLKMEENTGNKGENYSTRDTLKHSETL